MSNVISEEDFRQSLQEWVNQYFPKFPKDQNDFPFDYNADKFTIFGDMVQTDFNDDPAYCQKHELPTPSMWTATATATDSVKVTDRDVSFFGYVNIEDGLKDAAIRRLCFLATAITISIRLRQNQNMEAVSRGVFWFPGGEGSSEEEIPSSGRWIVDVVALPDHSGFEIMLTRSELYYIWAYWSKKAGGMRESAMSKPKVEEAKPRFILRS